jgi:hypothetical protein
MARSTTTRLARMHQRAKTEQYAEHLFFVARMVEQRERMETDQLSLFLGGRFVVNLLFAIDFFLDWSKNGKMLCSFFYLPSNVLPCSVRSTIASICKNH